MSRCATSSLTFCSVAQFFDLQSSEELERTLQQVQSILKRRVSSCHCCPANSQLLASALLRLQTLQITMAGGRATTVTARSERLQRSPATPRAQTRQKAKWTLETTKAAHPRSSK